MAILPNNMVFELEKTLIESALMCTVLHEQLVQPDSQLMLTQECYKGQIMKFYAFNSLRKFSNLSEGLYYRHDSAMDLFRALHLCHTLKLTFNILFSLLIVD